MTSKYINAVGRDFSYDYDKYVSGTKAVVSGYKTSSGQDLSDLFCPYINFNCPDSGYLLANNADISTIYQKSKWSAIISTNGIEGVNAPIYAISGYDLSHVYVGGQFTTAGGITVNRVAMWNGTSWSALTTGTNGTWVYTIGAYDLSHVYVGGQFTTAGGITVNRVAMWNGTSWSALTTGTNGTVESIYVYDLSHVYVGGTFTTAGGITANNIAMWNGTSWSALTTGTNTSVYTIHGCELNNVYVGGSFTTAGGLDISGGFAIWNNSNSSWSKAPSLPSEVSNSSTAVFGRQSAIYALDPTHIYVSNNNYSAGSFVLFIYNGSSWSYTSRLNTGHSFGVYAIDTSHVYLMSNYAAYIYDGSNNPVPMVSGNGLGYNTTGTGVIYAKDINRVYMGGSFTSTSVPCNYITMWNNGV